MRTRFALIRDARYPGNSVHLASHHDASMKRSLAILAAACALGIARGAPPEVKGAESEVLTFARKITERDIPGAYGLLAESYRKTLPFAAFEERAKWFLSSDFGPIQRVYVQDSNAMRGWRTRESDDIAWVYVIVEGASFADAISATVKREKGALRIRDIEWGKP